MTRLEEPKKSPDDPSQEIGITMATSAVAAICLLWPIAAAAQAVPDPVDDPNAWRTAGPYWLVILAGYAILRAFLREHSVLAKGRILSALTGIAMVASATLAWHFQGASLSGIWTAAAIAIALWVHPEVPATQAAALARQGFGPPMPPPPPASGTPSSGTPVAKILTIVLMIAGLGLSGIGLSANIACSGSAAERAGAAAAGGSTAFLQCEFAQLPPDTLSDIEALASSAVQRWLTGRGTIDEEGLRADMHLLRSALGQCMIAAAIGAVRGASGSGSDPGTASAALVADVDQIAQAFTRLRKERGWLPTQEELSWSIPKGGKSGQVK